MKTFRKRDHKGEQIVHKYLCEYFYPFLMQKCREVTDKEKQISGADEEIYINGKWRTIDEKTQLTRLGQNITEKTTQCIELLSKCRNGIYREGWINNHTDFYLFTYVTKCKTNNPNNLNDKNQIENIRAVLISKKSIEKMIKDSAFSLFDLKEIGKSLLTNTPDRETLHHKYKYLDNPNIWLCMTKETFLPEMPINIIVRWFLYEKYAWHVYNITPSEIIVLK